MYFFFFFQIIYAMGPWAVLYFVCIVLFGRFYLINLVLAVVTASYENEVQTSRMVSKKSYNTTFIKTKNCSYGEKSFYYI